MPVDDGVRVLVLTAPVGEGHLAAAATIDADIRAHDPYARVVVTDVLEHFNAPLRLLLCDAYRWQLGAAPWLFAIVFAGLRESRVLRWCSRILLSTLGSRSMLRLVRNERPDVIVSTFPASTAILGSLRLRGKVEVPVCATITDFGGLEMWAHQGVDLHLVMHESLVAAVEGVAGIGSARVVSPLVSAEFFDPRRPEEARSSLGLPLRDRLVVVSGGGWGVGDLSGAVSVALEQPDCSVICLAGRNSEAREELERAWADEQRVTVLGFTDRMSDLLAAADVLVHSTGGVTCLEALASGCPIVAYGAPPGHAPLLAREMAALGLLVNARTDAELRVALASVPDRSAATLTRDVDAADLVLGARPRVTRRFTARAARPLGYVAATALLVLAVFSSDLTYPLVADAFSLPETEQIAQSRQPVVLVVRGDASSLLAFAPVAEHHHLRASVTTSDHLEPVDIARLRAAGLNPIPEITNGGHRWTLSAERLLSSQVHDYGLGSHFYYLAPGDGFTLGEYLFARHLGGVPLQGRVPLGTSTRTPLRPGTVVVATLTPGREAATALLAAWERLKRIESTTRSRRPGAQPL